MNVLITGGTGFIGSRLALKCLEKGDKVIVLGQENNHHETENKKVIEKLGAEVYLNDITDKDFIVEISKNVDIPVIGVGGITTGEDALEYIMAGASALQIGSAIYYRGIDVFKKTCGEIETWMKNNGYKELSELIGVAHT